jgi:hypothetical protein
VSARPLPMPINPALLKPADERRQHFENRIADTITRFAGSMLLVYLHILWFAVWILSGVEHYSFGLLTMDRVAGGDLPVDLCDDQPEPGR